MGKVFSAEQIKQGNYPEMGDHTVVATEFLDHIRGVPHLSGAIVFGSVGFGNEKKAQRC